MNLAAVALRALPAAFIINAGIGKMGADAETSKGLQGFAATGIPALKKLPGEKFGKIIGASEIAVGATLAAPFVPNRLAGLALTSFSAGLLTLYFNNDGMTQKDGIRPTDEGLKIAKDSWLLAIGLGLLAGVNESKKAK